MVNYDFNTDSVGMMLYRQRVLSAGPVGSNGARGLQGSPGPQGNTGESGRRGTVGGVGSIGQPGVGGQPGSVGASGQPGPPGPAGPTGNPGQQGQRGPSGQPGSIGQQGTTAALFILVTYIQSTSRYHCCASALPFSLRVEEHSIIESSCTNHHSASMVKWLMHGFQHYVRASDVDAAATVRP